MPDTFTPTLNLTKVGIDESDDTWGQKLNANCDKIDAGIVSDRAKITALEERCAALETAAARASWVGEIRIHSGTIASIADIPGGVWKLCDGNNGTPNLVGKFVMGAGTGTAVGATGGAASWTGTVANKVMTGLRTVAHVLTWGQMPYHAHAGVTDQQGHHAHDVPWTQFGEGSGTGRQFYTPFMQEGVAQTPSAGAHTHNLSISGAGNDEGHDHALPALTHNHDATVPTLPPYYAFCYVKRTA